MSKKKTKVKLQIKKYSISFLLILAGTALMGLGVGEFLLPNKLSSGGFSGLATIFYYFLHIPAGTTILILNIPCFLMAYIKLGRQFFFKSLIGTISLSFFINLFEGHSSLTNDRVLACIYGGILVGVGTALVLKSNGSTGGSELVGLLIKNYKPNLSTSSIIVGFDIVIVTINMLAFRQLEIGLYSAITIFIMGKMLDIVFEGIGFSKMIFIISERYQEIAKEIGESVERGTTGIQAKGMYTQQEKLMLMCVTSRKEVATVRRISKEIDPYAFVIISNVREVYGKGFKKHSI